MTLSADFVIATAVAYVGLLFLIAYIGDRRSKVNKGAFLRSPFVYTPPISVYCPAGRSYAAVGRAPGTGLDYPATYRGRRWCSSAGGSYCGSSCGSATTSG